VKVSPDETRGMHQEGAPDLVALDEALNDSDSLTHGQAQS
jgi:hypothetical protein